MWANLLLHIVAALCLSVNAYPMFQANIPNGDRVPNPCNLSTIWPGAGHQNVYESDQLNPFWFDFAANEHVWNRTVCEKDSDGDGLTNGVELGDPDCNWTEGSHYRLETKLSHPGVCEPIDSSVCSVKNSWLMNCSPRKLDCPAINEPGVENYELRFPVTAIPSNETTYYLCHRFALPNDTVSDIIAIEPITDNALIHHMMIHACTDQPSGHLYHPVGESYRCGMETEADCRSLIGIWGAGVVGLCLNSQMGFRTGPGGIRYARLQLHWHNPELKSNQTDSSGMRIYHTTQLRPNRGQMAYIGLEYAEIPPGQKEGTITGTCSGRCTKKMSHSIFVTVIAFHMHSLGKAAVMSLRRNGKTVQVLDNVTNYDYHNPIWHVLETPIEINPGDEIEMKCVYDSTQRNSTTYIGHAASDEMCLGFLEYFPLIENFGICGQRKNGDICPFD